MRILDLAIKDLSQIFRDKMSLLFLVVMPIVFTFFMGLAFRGVVQPEDPRLALGWADADLQGALSQQLRAALLDSAVVRLVDVDPADVESVLHAGDVDGVLRIPTGFSREALNGDSVQLTLLADPFSIAGQNLYQVVRAPLVQAMSAAAIARLSVTTLDAQGALTDDAARAAERATALDTALQAWRADNQQAAWVRMEKVLGARDEDNGADAPLGGNPYNQSSPGMLVQFTIFGLVSSAQILVQERKTRTLQRLITTAMPPWQIIAGHMLAMFTVILLQTALLIAFGQIVLGVDYLRAPLGTLLIAVMLSLWVASMGLLVSVLAEGEEQVILFSMVAMFVFTSLAGAWFPLEGVGKVFSTIGHLTPGAWAMDGFQNILMRGLGLESAWRPAGVLLAYALGFFALAVWRFKTGEEG